MNRAYDTPVYYRHSSQRIKIRCYKMKRADGSDTTSIYSHYLSKQLLRAGTSIGANVEESIGGQSEKDFFAKLTDRYKEARETHYWIRLLTATDYLTKDKGESLLQDVEELLRIIGSIQKTLRLKNSQFVIPNS